jgi:diamine N-acetyltransferase
VSVRDDLIEGVWRTIPEEKASRLIELVPISPENYAEALKLAVHPEQETFVAGIVQTLADAYVWHESEFRLAFNDDVAVGYLLVFPFDRQEQRLVNIVRLMIDSKSQGKGLGGSLLDSAIEWISDFEPRPDLLRISTLPDNAVALSLYKSRGFEDAGTEDGEVALYKRVGIDA